MNRNNEGNDDRRQFFNRGGMDPRGGYRQSDRAQFSRPYFGPSSDRDDNNNRYNRNNNYNNFNSRRNFQSDRRPYNPHYDSYPHYQERPYQSFYPNYDNSPFNPYTDRNNFFDYESSELKEKLLEERNLKNKYDSFIDKIENAFYGQVTKDEIFNIIKTLIKMPSLTIFEAMNLIYREVIIYRTLTFYKINNDKSESLDGDIFENKYPMEYPTDSLNQIIENYKVQKYDENNNKENSYYLFEDEKIDKRRKITKNKEGIYNYLPIMKENVINISEEDKQNFEKLEIFANNEYEINFHPLFYKTIICNSCNINKDNYLPNPLCPYSHDIQSDFRIIYDYKEKTICELMNALSSSNLFSFLNYLNYIPKDINQKKINLQTFKVHKCLLDKSCPNDYHLCPFYHECEKEKDKKRRPPFLFRYSSEICENCFDRRKGKYIIENCPYGDFCNNIHSKNEHNYHKDKFRKEYKCTRNPKGKCPYINTCYGVHNESDYDQNSDEENEESEETIEEEKLEDDEIKDKKEKIEKILDISKNFRCRQCNFLKNIICFFSECKHFLCLTCFKKLNANLKKAKKENKNKNEENINLKCPFCANELGKEKIIKYAFSNKN